MPRRNYLQNSLTLAIGLMITTFLERKNVTDPTIQLSRVTRIAEKGRQADQIVADLKDFGFTCWDITDDQAGRTYNVPQVILCRKEFRERRLIFPTLLSVTLLIAEDSTLISFNHNIKRLSL